MSAHELPVDVPVGRSASPSDPPDRRPPAAEMAAPRGSIPLLTPAVDIYETPAGLVLEADLPGVADQDLTIRLEDNVLNLRGNVTPTLPPGAKVLHEEYRPGDFARSFILNDEVDRTRITASLQDGVLRVTLPRAERSRTRKIEIKTS